MKQRILVLNGQRLIERWEDEEWKTTKVAKAEELKGGVYNIFTARDGNKNQVTQGILVHATKDEIFLKGNYGFMKFDITEDTKIPAIGSHVNLSYDQDSLKIEKSEKNNPIN